MMLNISVRLMMLACIAGSVAAQPHFPHPDRIRYDGNCLSIEGKDIFIYSGSFHYFRCPKPLWRDRFAKIKEAGFNAVDTYVPWNWHEQEMPADVDDFSKLDLTDLKDWMKMAHEEFGLYTIIRPGPYICAEWAWGGFPVWLQTKKPANTDRNPWLRSDEPAFIAWNVHWMKAVAPVVAAEQITRKPPGEKGVILFQIENEYDLFGGVPENQRVNHLKALYRASVEGGIDVPIFTCWTKQVRKTNDPDLKNVFDTANTYPRWNMGVTAGQVSGTKRDQPHAPGMVAELQGGWFAHVGGELSEKQDGITAEQAQAVALTAIEHGATILNYYMLFGGTNFGDWGGRGMITSYDYFCPIRECGGVDAKYDAVKRVGQMLLAIGPKLARTTTIECSAENLSRSVSITARQSGDGDIFLFCFNRSRQSPEKGEASVRLAGREQPLAIQYDLQPFDFKVFHLPPGAAAQGTWYPQPVAPIARPKAPEPLILTSAKICPDPIEKAVFSPARRNETLAGHGIFDSRYLYYRATFSIDEQQRAKYRNLELQRFNSDPVLVRINGHRVPPTPDSGRNIALAVGDRLRAGENQIVMLYENPGYPHFGDALNDTGGLARGALTAGVAADSQLLTWRVKRLENPADAKNWTGAEVDDSTWPAFQLDDKTISEIGNSTQPGAETDGPAAARMLFGANAHAVFRCTLEVTPEMLAAHRTRLRFNRIDDTGVVYVNGQELGQSRDWRTPLLVDASAALKPGKNLIAVVVHNRGAQGGLTRAVELLSDGSDDLVLDWEISDNLGGVNANLHRPETTAHWKTVALADVSKAAEHQMATWIRLEFDMPKAPTDASVPWHVDLDATGNGMMYLNGEALGRYWEVGPQRKFYLPECWLKFGEKNVLTLCLRPTKDSPAIRSAEVAPYAEFTEPRK